MYIMGRGPENTIIQSKTLGEPFIFIAAVPRSRRFVDCIVEIGVRDVDFPRGDADYGTVFFVQGDDFEGVLAAEIEIIIGFIARRYQ